uniref:Uncharacterized protein n=1 Tax=Setaria italica TaxID=4555 RepID=K4A3V4_SETIT
MRFKADVLMVLDRSYWAKDKWLSVDVDFDFLLCAPG